MLKIWLVGNNPLIELAIDVNNLQPKHPLIRKFSGGYAAISCDFEYFRILSGENYV